jgi:hypothetical protein
MLFVSALNFGHLVPVFFGCCSCNRLKSRFQNNPTKMQWKTSSVLVYCCSLKEADEDWNIICPFCQTSLVLVNCCSCRTADGG